MPETIPHTDVETAVQKAAGVLSRGGVILYPTDTLYGLGADIENTEALEKLYRMKGRDEAKPVSVVAADLEMAEKYATLNDLARSLAERYLPGALTLVVPKTAAVPKEVSAGNTIGIRIPDNRFCIELARALNRPYTATSANRSGEEPKRNVADILAQLGEAADGVDLIIDAGELPERLPSTVVDASSATPSVLRKGSIDISV